LPALIILLFLAIAIGDLIMTLSEGDPVLPDMLQPESISFEPWEPAIDLRAPNAGPGVAWLPEPRLSGSLWSARDSTGVWMLGDGAELSIDVINGGHEYMVLEVRPAAGKRPVRSLRVSVNGVDCGAAALNPGWQRIELKLPPGTVRRGDNLIEFGVPDRSMVVRPRRAVHLRWIRLLRKTSSETGFPKSPPVVVSFEGQTAALRAAGELLLPFTVHEGIDALRLEYRFRGAGCSGEVIVARPSGGGVGRDASVRRELDARSGGVGRLRVPLHGRRGEFVFRLRLGPCADAGRFQIRSLKLVREGAGKARRRPKSSPEDRPR
jgi:hypothetical protein